MRNLFICLLAVATTLASCEQGEGKEGQQTTTMGTRYQYTTTNDEGQLANAGDYVYFQAMLLSEGDSVIFDTRAAGGPPPVIQAMADTINDETLIGPVEDVVRKLRVGERAKIRYNISETPPERRPQGLQNDSVLIYDIEVSEVVTGDEFAARQMREQEEAEAKAELVRGREEERLAFSQQVFEDYKAGKLDDELQSTPSGLRYVIHEEGNGAEAEAGKQVVVQYIGRLSDNGDVFDQSFERGTGIPFPLGAQRVIAGWDEGIDLLQEGDRATLIIPSEIGYGAQGSGATIPPDSELMFYVELEDVM